MSRNEFQLADALVVRVDDLRHHLAAIPDLVSWYRDGWPQFLAGRNHSEIAALIESRCQGRRVPLCQLATAEGEPVGTVSLVDDPLPGFEDCSPWLSALYVRPDFRGKGIARLLVGAAVERARGLGWPQVYIGLQEHQQSLTARGWEFLQEIRYGGEFTSVLVYDFKRESSPTASPAAISGGSD